MHARPYPRAANWAKSTPLFLYVETEEQAQGMGALVIFLSERSGDSIPKSSLRPSKFWAANSESPAINPESAEEGNKVSVLVNKYERNRRNRELCIQAHRAVCSVCGFDFAREYGEIGVGYIHVHHLTPLAVLEGKARKIDPVKDLLPVCPNCHEMLHRCSPPYTINRLKQMIANAKADRQKSPLSC